MFSAAGMRKARAGVGIAARRAHVRLGASGGPPAGRVFLGLAHLHAAAADAGFCAAAIAASCGDAAQKGRRIRKKGKRAGEEANCAAEEAR